MKERTTSALGIVAIAGLILTGCAGSAGQDAEAGHGFEYGSTQEDVNAIISELEPVTLTYQPAATSPNSVQAPAAQEFKDYVEERSNGQIEIELVYGRAIASYDETDDALADGRLDLAFHVPVYFPSDYPSYSAISTALQGLPTSPVLGEAVYYAVAEEIGWSSSDLLGEYENMGVTPLATMMNGGSNYPLCNDLGTSPEDWEGRQVRVNSTAHLEVVEGLSASPVSMEYEEMYEALQRGTIDCAIAPMTPSAEGGVIEVAPHISYSSDAYSLSSRTSPTLLAGSSFDQLPLAYQQILFDAGAYNFAGFLADIINGNALAVEQAKQSGGTVTPIDSDTEELIGQTQEEQVQRLIDEGLLDQDINQRIEEAAAKWTEIAVETGVEDPGSFEDMDEWWSDRAIDFIPFAQRVFEDTALAHRPE